MVDTKTPGDKTLSVPTKTLTLKPRVETGTVRQSFSHGRRSAASAASAATRPQRRRMRPNRPRPRLRPRRRPRRRWAAPPPRLLARATPDRA